LDKKIPALSCAQWISPLRLLTIPSAGGRYSRLRQENREIRIGLDG
jgi:hypothetical protein